VQQVLIPGGTGAVWKPRRYDTFAKEAYLTQVVSYRCIDEIAEAVESTKWRINKEKRDGSVEQVTDHPFIDLMYRPNPEQTFGELLYRQTAFGIISGNGYMERIGPDTGGNRGVYRELWVHRPDRMSINVNPETGVRRGYKYTGPSGRSREWQIDPINGRSDIWHMKFFHPLNDWYGAGPVEPTAREIDTSNEAMEWNKNLLQNQGRPGMIVAFKGNIGDTEYNRLEKKLREKYGGPKNTGKHMIIEGDGATVTPYGWSPLDMDYIEGNRELARRIALGFGVPPQLLGIPGDNTYSNYAEARLAFYENTVFFYLGRIGGGLSMWMFEPKERLTLVPDYDKMPALEPRRKEQFEKAEHADFLTINEKRRMTGFENYAEIMPDAEDDKADPADKIYQNASMMPLGENPQEDPMGGEDDLASAEEEARLAAEQQAAEGGDKPKPGEPKPEPKKPGTKPGEEE
jgi:HK97 family phage portal protein